MPRSTAPKEPQPQADAPVSLIGQPADVPQPGPSQEIVIDKVESKPAPGPVPAPVVTTDKNGDIVIK